MKSILLPHQPPPYEFVIIHPCFCPFPFASTIFSSFVPSAFLPDFLISHIVACGHPSSVALLNSMACGVLLDLSLYVENWQPLGAFFILLAPLVMDNNKADCLAAHLVIFPFFFLFFCTKKNLHIVHRQYKEEWKCLVLWIWRRYKISPDRGSTESPSASKRIWSVSQSLHL